MNLVEAMFTQVKYTAFLYNDQVVWYVLHSLFFYCDTHTHTHTY